MKITKTQQAIQAFQSGDVKTALGIVRTFRVGVSKEQQKIFSQGYECLVHPSFYAQLKANIPARIEKAKREFESMFLNAINVK